MDDKDNQASEFDKAADSIMDILEKHFHEDIRLRKHLLFSIIMSYFRSDVLAMDMSNEDIGSLIVSELNSAMIAHFAVVTSREIWKSIFISIVKQGLMDKS